MAFSPIFFSPVAVNSTDTSAFCSCLRALTIFSSALVAPSSVRAVFWSTVTVVVLAVITTVARGANQIAQTKKTRSASAAPPIIKSFLRNEEKFGTFLVLGDRLPAADFTGSAITLDLMAALMATSAFLLEGVAERAISPIGSFSPSIMSSSSTLSTGTSISSGLLWRLRATGIFAAAARDVSDGLLDISTRRLFACSAVRCSSRILTAL